MGIVMFFKSKMSTLDKVLNNYNSLFEMWKKESFKDDSIDEITYKKDNIVITFQEDLREHITNLFIINFQKKIGKVYYRDVDLSEELIGVKELKKALALLENKNNCEKQEVGIYIEFLKLNNIL